MKKKVLFTSLILSSAAYLFSEYFFKLAMTPFHKEFDSKELNGQDPIYPEKVWLQNFKKQSWSLKVNKKISLFANYLNHHSDKTVILLHGFMSDGDSMAGFAKMFYDFGFNVLLPDARSHGRSSGKYIGYGWVEKDDIRRWIEKVIARNSQDQKIVVMGHSMGAATTMMVSGLKLPSQVKCFIEDCGYSDVTKEIIHQAQHEVGVPKTVCKPAVKAISGLNKLRNGFFLKNASSIKQLKKNTRPILFIHGAKDNIVPSQMVYENYKAANEPKELWVTPLAGHAQSFSMYKKQYRQKVKVFLDKYC